MGSCGMERDHRIILIDEIGFWEPALFGGNWLARTYGMFWKDILYWKDILDTPYSKRLGQRD